MSTENKNNDQKRVNLSKTLRRNLQRRKFSPLGGSSTENSETVIHNKKNYYKSRKFSKSIIIRFFQKIGLWISRKFSAIFGKKSSAQGYHKKRYRSFNRYRRNNKNISHGNTGNSQE